MNIVKVKQSFFDLCSQKEIADQLMKTKKGRPGVLIIKLKYKN